jgi:hypothetical protein
MHNPPSSPVSASLALAVGGPSLSLLLHIPLLSTISATAPTYGLANRQRGVWVDVQGTSVTEDGVSAKAWLISNRFPLRMLI